jgi:hypothetical protein
VWVIARDGDVYGVDAAFVRRSLWSLDVRSPGYAQVDGAWAASASSASASSASASSASASSASASSASAILCALSVARTRTYAGDVDLDAYPLGFLVEGRNLFVYALAESGDHWLYNMAISRLSHARHKMIKVSDW